MKDLNYTSKKRSNLDKESIKEDLFRMMEENKILRQENNKLKEENEMLSENKNLNANKVSLLNKIKQENSKLKEEVNELRKTNEFIEKNCNFKGVFNKTTGQKLNSIEYASIMSQRDSELNECHRIMHSSLVKIKSVFENSNDEFVFTFKEPLKHYIEGKSLDEKFSFYLEKLINFIDVYINFFYEF